MIMPGLPTTGYRSYKLHYHSNSLN